MAEIETRGFGDDECALRRLEAKFGIGYWTLRYLKLGRAATVDSERPSQRLSFLASSRQGRRCHAAR
jgi:hypothetical protein